MLSWNNQNVLVKFKPEKGELGVLDPDCRVAHQSHHFTHTTRKSRKRYFPWHTIIGTQQVKGSKCQEKGRPEKLTAIEEMFSYKLESD